MITDMWQRIWLWLDQNKLVAGTVLLLAGVVLRDLLPYIWRLVVNLMTWIGKKLGGRLGYRHLEKNYLNWLVTELRELKLTGIVSADTTKKPRLEQVFVSLRVGEQEGRFSAVEAAVALADEIKRRKGKIHPFIIRGLKRDLEQAPAAERKDAERILTAQLMRYRSFGSWQRFVRRIFGRPTPVPISEERLLQDFLESRHTDGNPSSEYAAILLHKVVRDQSRIAILGSPGAGKTTLLQYIGLAYARAHAGEKKLRTRHCHRKWLGATKWRLPVFISLGTIAKKMTETLPGGKAPSIIDALSQVLPPDLEGDTKGYFTSRLKKGRCIVLLDGLDEVPTDEEFRAVVRAIESL
jgi:hypothetical protein